MRYPWVAAVCAALPVLTGCGVLHRHPDSTVPIGQSSRTLTVDGRRRTVHLYRFLVAYPDGLDRAWSVGGGCCGVPGRTGVDDVRFITAMLDDIRRAVPVDPARVYATGISNGGLLAYRLACDTTEFAAIGPDSATMLGACPTPAPVSVIHLHGTADTRIP